MFPPLGQYTIANLGEPTIIQSGTWGSATYFADILAHDGTVNMKALPDGRMFLVYGRTVDSTATPGTLTTNIYGRIVTPGSPPAVSAPAIVINNDVAHWNGFDGANYALVTTPGGRAVVLNWSSTSFAVDILQLASVGCTGVDPTLLNTLDASSYGTALSYNAPSLAWLQGEIVLLTYVKSIVGAVYTSGLRAIRVETDGTLTAGPELTVSATISASTSIGNGRAVVARDFNIWQVVSLSNISTLTLQVEFEHDPGGFAWDSWYQDILDVRPGPVDNTFVVPNLGDGTMDLVTVDIPGATMTGTRVSMLYESSYGGFAVSGFYNMGPSVATWITDTGKVNALYFTRAIEGGVVVTHLAVVEDYFGTPVATYFDSTALTAAVDKVKWNDYGSFNPAVVVQKTSLGLVLAMVAPHLEKGIGGTYLADASFEDLTPFGKVFLFDMGRLVPNLSGAIVDENVHFWRPRIL